MYRSPVRLLTAFVLIAFGMSALTARAQERDEPDVHSEDFLVLSSNTFFPLLPFITNTPYSINVHHKFSDERGRIPVLLVHGSWGNAQTWDFPGRSVMDFLAVSGYDVYALDLRGEGHSVPADGSAVNFANVDITGRVNDVAAVAAEIYTLTGRRPVLMGWSQGGFISGLLASYPATAGLISGLGLLSVAPAGFTVPPAFQSLLPLPVPSFTLTEPEENFVLFGTNPITGKSTMSTDAENTLYAISAPNTDATWAIDEIVAPAAFGLVPAWSAITVPTLVVDGALDPLVGTQDSITLIKDLTGTANKALIVFPFNSHAWFLEDDHDVTVLVLDLFLSQFKSSDLESRR